MVNSSLLDSDSSVTFRFQEAPGSLATGGFTCYSINSVTTPEPTVLPPSRMANRLPASSAIGLSRFTSRACGHQALLSQSLWAAKACQ